MEKRKIIEWSLRTFLAVVFCFSAYTKLIVPGVIEIILVDHGLAASRETAAIYVRLLIGFEFSIGLLFLQPYYLKKIVFPAALFFLLGFSFYLVYSGFILKDMQNCGCFGETIKMSPFESILKNILLMIPVGYLFITGKENRTNFYLPAFIVIVSVGLVFVFSPAKHSKDFRFSNYTSFENYGRVDLASGNNLIAVFNTECDHCQNTAKELTALGKQINYPQLFVLFFTEGQVSVDSFKALTKSNFPYKMIRTREFFDLIGQSPPRIYWLKEGKVKAVWDKDFKENIISSFSVKEQTK